MKPSKMHFFSPRVAYLALLTCTVVFPLTAGSVFCQSTQGSPSTLSGEPNYQEMVKVEGGYFKAPKKSVKDFRIGKYEVTRGEWQEVANWAAQKGYDINSGGCAPGDTNPVAHVSWYDVVKWCNAKSEMEGLDPVYQVNGKTYKSGVFGIEDCFIVKIKSGTRGYRLPTLIEWEWAARGGKKSKNYTYAGSNNLDEVAWTNNNSGGRQARPVGIKQPNELGIYDMHGNVRERTWDFTNCGGDFKHPFSSQFASKFQLPTRNQGTFNRDGCQGGGGWAEVVGFRLARDSGL